MYQSSYQHQQSQQSRGASSSSYYGGSSSRGASYGPSHDYRYSPYPVASSHQYRNPSSQKQYHTSSPASSSAALVVLREKGDFERFKEQFGGKVSFRITTPHFSDNDTMADLELLFYSGKLQTASQRVGNARAFIKVTCKIVEQPWYMVTERILQMNSPHLESTGGVRKCLMSECGCNSLMQGKNWEQHRHTISHAQSNIKAMVKKGDSAAQESFRKLQEAMDRNRLWRHSFVARFNIPSNWIGHTSQSLHSMEDEDSYDYDSDSVESMDLSESASAPATNSNETILETGRAQPQQPYSFSSSLPASTQPALTTYNPLPLPKLAASSSLLAPPAILPSPSLYSLYQPAAVEQVRLCGSIDSAGSQQPILPGLVPQRSETPSVGHVQQQNLQQKDHQLQIRLLSEENRQHMQLFRWQGQDCDSLLKFIDANIVQKNSNAKCFVWPAQASVDAEYDVYCYNEANMQATVTQLFEWVSAQPVGNKNVVTVRLFTWPQQSEPEPAEIPKLQEQEPTPTQIPLPQVKQVMEQPSTLVAPVSVQTTIAKETEEPEEEEEEDYLIIDESDDAPVPVPVPIPVQTVAPQVTQTVIPLATQQVAQHLDAIGHTGQRLDSNESSATKDAADSLLSLKDLPTTVQPQVLETNMVANNDTDDVEMVTVVTYEKPTVIEEAPKETQVKKSVSRSRTYAPAVEPRRSGRDRKTPDRLNLERLGQ